jgi:hypothetical protein
VGVDPREDKGNLERGGQRGMATRRRLRRAWSGETGPREIIHGGAGGVSNNGEGRGRRAGMALRCRIPRRGAGTAGGNGVALPDSVGEGRGRGAGMAWTAVGKRAARGGGEGRGHGETYCGRPQ